MAHQAAVFRKNTGVELQATQEKDYLHYWQIWHHNWDDADISLVKELCSIEGSNILEVGCGDGRISIGLSKECCSITGIDLHEQFISVAKKRLERAQTPNVEFLEMDAQRLKLPDRSFDIVLFPWVLQMVQSPLAALTEAYRVLKTDGVALIIGLRSDSDYDRIINRFAPNSFTIDPHTVYEEPLRQAFGQDGILLIDDSRRFKYFFETKAIAHEAFVFAFARWYSKRLSEWEQEQLGAMLREYEVNGRICLEFAASIYLAKKIG